MARKVISARFVEGIGKASNKTFDLAQPVLNTGVAIKNISLTEEKNGLLCKWTDHHNQNHAILVPYSNIKDLEFEASSLDAAPVVEVKPLLSQVTKKN